MERWSTIGKTYFHSLASNGLSTENVLYISWTRSSRVVRASGCQCQSRNSPGFDPSILRHSWIWETEDKAVLNNVHKNLKKKPPFIIRSRSHPVGKRLQIDGKSDERSGREAINFLWSAKASFPVWPNVSVTDLWKILIILFLEEVPYLTEKVLSQFTHKIWLGSWLRDPVSGCRGPKGTGSGIPCPQHSRKLTFSGLVDFCRSGWIYWSLCGKKYLFADS